MNKMGTSKLGAGHKLKIWDFAKWDVKTINEFDNLLISLEATPSSKILLSQMIKYSEMYRPAKAHPLSFDYLGIVKGVNEYREERRSQIYLLEKDLLKVNDRGSGKKLLVTSRGKKIFYGEYPLAKLRSQKWDGHWVIVTYDFPEVRRKQRNYFREKLVDLGFGMPQESLLVCPLPLETAVEDLVEGEKLSDCVWVLKAERVLGLENRDVAKRAWNLGKINGLYEKLLEVWPRVKVSKSKGLKQEWERLYLAVDLADPYLPLELLPEDWLGEKCRKQFYGSGFLNSLRNIFDS